MPAASRSRSKAKAKAGKADLHPSEDPLSSLVRDEASPLERRKVISAILVMGPDGTQSFRVDYDRLEVSDLEAYAILDRARLEVEEKAYGEVGAD